MQFSINFNELIQYHKIENIFLGIYVFEKKSNEKHLQIRIS